MVQPIRPHDANGIYRQQVSQTQAAEAAANGRAASGARGQRSDRVTLSEGAREFARIMEAVTAAPDTRASRVEALRSQVQSGQYEVDYLGLAALLHDRGVGS